MQQPCSVWLSISSEEKQDHYRNESLYFTQKDKAFSRNKSRFFVGCGAIGKQAGTKRDDASATTPGAAAVGPQAAETARAVPSCAA